MEPFTTFEAIGLPIEIANCDTDQIIPARFLRRGKNDPDYPKFLFHDLRFEADGTEKDFIYNKAPFSDAKIVVADVNWGCGSSRENAVTALVANGFRAVIAPSIADIHFNNCMKNGVLPVRLSIDDCAALRGQLQTVPGARISVDLERQEVTGPDGTVYGFELGAFDKLRMLKGLDDISVTLEYDSEISDFEGRYKNENTWIY
jgi:3-isopropylmalate/(R)-2-methylmalate dehydratase small subunit